jgi:aryl-alcohol dehydrogenase-like predicted oxidoreductase
MRLALGTAQFGQSYGISNKSGQVSQSAAKSIINLAKSSRINMLDTAIAYGESEATLGLIGVKDFKLVTKLPPFGGIGDPQCWVSKEIRSSLSRLNLNSVYAVLIHRPEQLNGSFGAGIYDGLQLLKHQGLVEKIGISIYSPVELIPLMEKFHFDLVQAPLNLVDRRIVNSGWLTRLKDCGVEIHARSVFLQGLLLMGQTEIPLKFERWKNIFEKWHDFLKLGQISALEACIAYPLSFSEVDKVIVGVESQEQLIQILTASTFSKNINLPNISCEDEDFVNPANWANL